MIWLTKAMMKMMKTVATAVADVVIITFKKINFLLNVKRN